MCAVNDPGSAAEVLEFLNHVKPVDPRMPPLGFHTDRKPDSSIKCDLPGCMDSLNRQGVVKFRGCSHAYYTNCLLDICQTCKSYLKTKIGDLSQKISHGVESTQPAARDHEVDDDEVNEGQSVPV